MEGGRGDCGCLDSISFKISAEVGASPSDIRACDIHCTLTLVTLTVSEYGIYPCGGSGSPDVVGGGWEDERDAAGAAPEWTGKARVRTGTGV